MEERNSLIDILKGTAMIAVLLGHSIIVYPVNIQGITFWGFPLVAFVSSFQMCLLFAVSGYLCSYKGNYLSYVKKRAKRVLLPYFIFNVAALSARMLFTQFVNRDVGSVKEMIIKLFCQGEGTQAGYWFLYTIFAIALIAPLLCKLIHMKYGKQILVMIGLCCMVLSCTIDITGYFTLEYIVYYLPYYIVGMFIGNRKKSFNHLIYIDVSVFAVYALAFAYKLITKTNEYYLGYILGFTSVYLLWTLFSKIKLPKLLKHHLEMSGIYSLQYYLLNAFVMTGCRVLIVTVCGIKNPIAIVSLMFLLTYAISYVVSVYVIDSNNLLRFVCGLKVKRGEDKKQWKKRKSA